MRPHPLLHAILLAVGGCIGAERSTGEVCMVAASDTCPRPKDVEPGALNDPWDCDNEVVEALDGDAPEPEVAFRDGSNGCCYEVERVDRSPGSECIVGRPYRHGDRALTAPRSTSSLWEEVALAEVAADAVRDIADDEDARTVAEVAADGVRDVVAPAATALLAA
jgi:hypothetical protein